MERLSDTALRHIQLCHALRLAFDVMREVEHCTFMVLTKRAKRMAAWTDWPPNVWAGVSVEGPDWLKRIASAPTVDASVRFASIEPLLGPMGTVPELVATFEPLQWIIVGGESGPEHRPMPHNWVWPIRDACGVLGIPFYFKQSSAGRTESGTSLRHENGTYWFWGQFPDALTPPTSAVPHRWSGLD